MACGGENVPNSVAKQHITVHWFRHGLRLHDNPAILEGLENCVEFYPIFIFDGEVAGTKTSAYPRMKFLHHSLVDLDDSFKKHDGRLYIFYGKPVEVLKNIFQEWNVTRLTFEQDPEPIWVDRDNAVKSLCHSMGVQVIEKVSHTLWDPKEVVEANGGRPPHTYKLFNQVVDLIGAPPRPLGQPNFKNVELPVPKDFDANELKPLKEMNIIPEDANQENPHNVWIGGESDALEHLSLRLSLEASAYKMGYIMPNQYSPDLTGPPLSMSPHLRFGCLSVRRFYWDLHDTFKRVRKEECPPNLTAQLIWREYFYCMSYNNLKFNQMEGNPICLQINWYKDEEKLQKWAKGQTGFPWIDACMRQLRWEGWLHHTGRHAVSCFLTRGDLWLSWEDGLKVFDKYLLDGDWSVCAGNWMWVSSSAFENVLSCPQCFSPILYGMRMDPTGVFTRRYVPELKKMPLKYLFQPWKAPREVQEAAGCEVGKDYPQPMVDHREASRKCRAAMEEAKALLRDPTIWHCTPSDTEEVRKFCWLPDHLATGGVCRADFLCEGIEGL